MNTLWILESVKDEKFPFLISIVQGDTVLLRLRVQDCWPGQKGNVFCLRVDDPFPAQRIEELERIGVISLKRFGKRLAVVLDRPKNKRCDFLFLIKQYKTRDGEYEQIFWRTQQALKQRKPKVKLTTYTRSALSIAVDSNERYPWRFPDTITTRELLPIGDYALKKSNRILAVVERKTLDNICAEFSRMSVFHQQLSELEAYRNAAIVIEANYSDFLNPDKMQYYPPAFTAMAMAELHALHPKLLIVYAGNRKCAREWTLQFFTALTAHAEDMPHHKVSEVIAGYGTPPEATGGIYYAIRRQIQDDFPPEFTMAMLRTTFPAAPQTTLQRVLRNLKKEGIVAVQGKGKKSFWVKTS